MKNKLVSLNTHAFNFLPQITAFLFGVFQKSNQFASFWGKIRQNVHEKLTIFPWNLFSYLNNNQFQCIWAVKDTYMSFAFEILANYIKISLKCLNKSLKKTKTKTNAFRILSFLTWYGKQTCFYFGLIILFYYNCMTPGGILNFNSQCREYKVIYYLILPQLLLIMSISEIHYLH